LAGTLEDAVSQLVAHSESDARTAATATDAAIARGRMLLISVAIASLLVALVIGAFYIGRSVARRLGDLRNSMAEIAGGNFDAGGGDEIAEMASALRKCRRHGSWSAAALAAEARKLSEEVDRFLGWRAHALKPRTTPAAVDSAERAGSELRCFPPTSLGYSPGTAVGCFAGCSERVPADCSSSQRL
jgi:hypothetical protein